MSKKIIKFQLKKFNNYYKKSSLKKIVILILKLKKKNLKNQNLEINNPNNLQYLENFNSSKYRFYFKKKILRILNYLNNSNKIIKIAELRFKLNAHLKKTINN